MYKTNADLAQRRARQLWLADLQGKAFEEQPPHIQRANLVRAAQSLQEKVKQYPKGSTERHEIGHALGELNTRINAIRPKCKGPSTVEGFFIDVCRERMTKFQFSVIMHEASKRAHAAQVEAA